MVTRVEIMRGGDVIGEGFLWRPDVVVAQAAGVRTPVGVRFADGHEVAVTTVHETPLHIEAARRFVALELPEGSAVPEEGSSLPWPAPIAPASSTLPDHAWWGWVFPELDDVVEIVTAHRAPPASLTTATG